MSPGKKRSAVAAVLAIVAGMAGFVGFFGDIEEAVIFLDTLHSNHWIASAMLLAIVVGMFVLAYIQYAVFVKLRDEIRAVDTHATERIDEAMEKRTDWEGNIREWKGGTDARLNKLEQAEQLDIAISKLPQ